MNLNRLFIILICLCSIKSYAFETDNDYLDSAINYFRKISASSSYNRTDSYLAKQFSIILMKNAKDPKVIQLWDEILETILKSNGWYNCDTYVAIHMTENKDLQQRLINTINRIIRGENKEFNSYFNSISAYNSTTVQKHVHFFYKIFKYSNFSQITDEFKNTLFNHRTSIFAKLSFDFKLNEKNISNMISTISHHNFQKTFIKKRFGNKFFKQYINDVRKKRIKKAISDLSIYMKAIEQFKNNEITINGLRAKSSSLTFRNNIFLEDSENKTGTELIKKILFKALKYDPFLSFYRFYLYSQMTMDEDFKIQVADHVNNIIMGNGKIFNSYNKSYAAGDIFWWQDVQEGACLHKYEKTDNSFCNINTDIDIYNIDTPADTNTTQVRVELFLDILMISFRTYSNRKHIKKLSEAMSQLFHSAKIPYQYFQNRMEKYLHHNDYHRVLAKIFIRKMKGDDYLQNLQIHQAKIKITKIYPFKQILFRLSTLSKSIDKVTSGENLNEEQKVDVQKDIDQLLKVIFIPKVNQFFISRVETLFDSPKRGILKKLWAILYSRSHNNNRFRQLILNEIKKQIHQNNDYPVLLSKHNLNTPSERAIFFATEIYLDTISIQNSPEYLSMAKDLILDLDINHLIKDRVDFLLCTTGSSEYKSFITDYAQAVNGPDYLNAKLDCSNVKKKKIVFTAGGYSITSNDAHFENEMLSFHHQLFHSESILLYSGGPGTGVFDFYSSLNNTFYRDNFFQLTPSIVEENVIAATTENFHSTFANIAKNPPDEVTTVFAVHGSSPEGLGLWTGNLNATTLKNTFQQFPESTVIRSIYMACHSGAAIVDPERTIPTSTIRISDYLNSYYFKNRCAVSASSDDEPGWSMPDIWSKMFAKNPNMTLQSFRDYMFKNNSAISSPVLTSDYITQDILQSICSEKDYEKSLYNHLADASKDIWDDIITKHCNSNESNNINNIRKKFTYTMETFFNQINDYKHKWSLELLKREYPDIYERNYPFLKEIDLIIKRQDKNKSLSSDDVQRIRYLMTNKVSSDYLLAMKSLPVMNKFKMFFNYKLIALFNEKPKKYQAYKNTYGNLTENKLNKLNIMETIKRKNYRTMQNLQKKRKQLEYPHRNSRKRIIQLLLNDPSLVEIKALFDSVIRCERTILN